MKLIKLDYAVLSTLVHNELSGYDITARLQVVWKTTHSRVYPVLSKLEKLKLVEYRNEEQINKPNKKIYKITNEGINTIKSWLEEPPASSIKKDEGLLKIMCIDLLDIEHRQQLIKKRINRSKKELEQYRKLLPKIENQIYENSYNTNKSEISIHILNEAINTFIGLEITFSEWVLHILENSNNKNIVNYKFSDYVRDNFIKDKYLTKNKA